MNSFELILYKKIKHIHTINRLKEFKTPNIQCTQVLQLLGIGLRVPCEPFFIEGDDFLGTLDVGDLRRDQLGFFGVCILNQKHELSASVRGS